MSIHPPGCSRHLALQLQSARHDIRILGLTASLTYAVAESKVLSAAQRLCKELRIKHMATAGPEELKEAGYEFFHA